MDRFKFEKKDAIMVFTDTECPDADLVAMPPTSPGVEPTTLVRLLNRLHRENEELRKRVAKLESCNRSMS